MNRIFLFLLLTACEPTFLPMGCEPIPKDGKCPDGFTYDPHTVADGPGYCLLNASPRAKYIRGEL